jgi:hypothetical protein
MDSMTILPKSQYDKHYILVVDSIILSPAPSATRSVRRWSWLVIAAENAGVSKKADYIPNSDISCLSVDSSPSRRGRGL